MNKEKLTIVLDLLSKTHITIDQATTLMYETQTPYWTYPWTWYKPYEHFTTYTGSVYNTTTDSIEGVMTKATNSIENIKTAIKTELEGFKNIK
jgi:hypothetical protein